MLCRCCSVVSTVVGIAASVGWLEEVLLFVGMKDGLPYDCAALNWFQTSKPQVEKRSARRRAFILTAFTLFRSLGVNATIAMFCTSVGGRYATSNGQSSSTTVHDNSLNIYAKKNFKKVLTNDMPSNCRHDLLLLTVKKIKRRGFCLGGIPNIIETM
jgi:hypothetical protein